MSLNSCLTDLIFVLHHAKPTQVLVIAFMTMINAELVEDLVTHIRIGVSFTWCVLVKLALTDIVDMVQAHENLDWPHIPRHDLFLALVFRGSIPCWINLKDVAHSHKDIGCCWYMT